MRGMRALIIVTLAAGVAEANPNEIEVGGSGRVLRSASADAVTADSLSGGQLAYMRQLTDVLALPRFELWVGGGVEFGSATGSMFQTMTTEIGSYAIVGMARARYQLIEHVHATARVALGTASTSLKLTDGSGPAVSDSGWGAQATGAAGLDLTALENTRTSLGVRIELGYTRASAPALNPQPASPDDGTLHLKMSEASIGHLDLSGPFLAISLITSF
jgi:hypothetical protein